MRQELLTCALFTPMRAGNWGLPLLVEDTPGTAKTAVIRQIAAAWGLPCKVLSPGEEGEGAFGVVPVPLNGRLVYPAPEWVDLVADGGVVFIDECGSIPPMIQAPVLGLIAEKKIGGAQLSLRVRVLGAMNDTDISANGHDLSAPLANRFGHLKWGHPTVEQHMAFMLGLGGKDQEVAPRSAEAEEARVLRAWPEAWARAVGLEVAFLQAQPQWKNAMPKQGDPALSKAWPSDRTWEYATRALASADVHSLSETDRDEFVAAFVGHQAHEHFAAFIESADLPKPADVLDGRVKFSWEPKRLDRSSAIVTACAALVVPPEAPRRRERAKVLWEMLGSASHYDVTVPVAKQLVGAKLHVGMDALPVLARLEPILSAAGVKPGEAL